MSAMTADEVIARLQLEPHPEGGHYRETWRDEPDGDGRGVGTAIDFLLRAGERRRGTGSTPTSCGTSTPATR